VNRSEQEPAAYLAHAASLAPVLLTPPPKAAVIVPFGTDLADPDFTGIAQTAGLFGVRVEKASEREDAPRTASAHDGPALATWLPQGRKQELALPSKITYGQVKVFTLDATRTILSGQGSELIEFTRTNPREPKMRSK
jgi:pyruvate dehydrogenase (quinone)